METTVRLITVILVGGILSIFWFFIGCKYEEMPKPNIKVLKIEKADKNKMQIRYVEINNHEYILYREGDYVDRVFCGMTHNPDCKYCKKDK